jgi:hypothetical protein
LANILVEMNTHNTDQEWHYLPRTRLSWRGLGGWIDTVFKVNAKMRCSAVAHERADRLYRWLTSDVLRASRDLDALETLSALLRQARYTDAPLTYGFGRAFSRSELGVLIVEADNQAAWVRRGCPQREKGPRLDPSRLPDDRLDFLIQRHEDMAVVESLREEKRRRIQDGGSSQKRLRQEMEN